MSTDSLVGAVPEHWKVTTLGEACAAAGGGIQTGPFGSQLHASDYVPAGIPSIMPQNIGENRVLTVGIARITESDAQRLGRYRVRAGDVVYSRRGDVEKRALIREVEDGWICGTGCLRVRFGNGNVDPLYASYYLGHPAVRKWIVQHAIGATMPNLNTSILSTLPFILPSVTEQHDIGQILGRLDDKIELNRQMSETLEAIARAIFTSWFVDFVPVRANMDGQPPPGIDAETGALFPDSLNDSVLGDIPRGWGVRSVRDLVTLSRKSLDPTESPTEVFDHYSIPAFDEGRVPAEAQGLAIRSNKLVVTPQMVLVSKLNPRITRIWLPFPTPNRRSIASTEFLAVNPRGGLSRAYLYSLFSSDEFMVRFAGLVTGTSGSHQRVKPEDFLGMLIVVPEPKVIKVFTSLTEPLFAKVAANVRESQTLAKARDALLPRLISGELRVTAAEEGAVVP